MQDLPIYGTSFLDGEEQTYPGLKNIHNNLTLGNETIVNHIEIDTLKVHVFPFPMKRNKDMLSLTGVIS